MSESSSSANELAGIASFYLGFCASSGPLLTLFLSVHKARRDSLKETVAGMQHIAVHLEPKMQCLWLVHTHTLAHRLEALLPTPPDRALGTHLHSVALSFFCCLCRREGCLCMHAHRGREIPVLPASCSSSSGHHHCHFTSDCTDPGNSPVSCGKQQKGWEALEGTTSSCPSVHESLLLACLWVPIFIFQCVLLTLVIGEETAA